MTEDIIGYNSAYVSINLLDELDYCIGGYGKPKIEFLFSLNTFVETFIASSTFYTSLDELNHLNLTAPALFPNGRPMLNMLVKAGGLRFVKGVVDKPGKEIYRNHATVYSRKSAQQDFIIEYGQNMAARYFIQSDVTVTIDKIPLITAKLIGEDFIVSEVLTSSGELVSNLLSVSATSSIQTTLPIYLYEQQIGSLVRKPYSIQALDRLAKLQEANVEELVKSLNFKYLPIPPFTSILLSQVASVSEIPQKLIQLRLDFQQLRDKFMELEHEIADADSLKKQHEAFRRFQEFWSAFNRKYTGKRHRILFGLLDFSSGVDIDKGIDRMIDDRSISEGLKDLNFGKLGGNILTTAYTNIKDKRIVNRFKGLTNIWELFQSGKGIEQQIKHFERLFGVTYTHAEIKNVQQFVNDKLANLPKQIIS